MTRSILLAAFLLLALPAFSCSIFTASVNGEVLVGANEDGSDPFGKMWVMPPRAGRYGGLYFGLSFLDKQAGMNEHGLFFDYAALDAVQPDFDQSTAYIYIEEIMETCKTVAEALEFLQKHGYAINTAQLMLADATGASAIVTPERIIAREGNYQIATNFNSCNPKEKINCRRYQRIESGLVDAKEISTSKVRELLDAVHVEGSNTTLYSKVFDLKRGEVRLYNFHDYDRPVVINLADAFTKGFQITEVYDLFSYHSFAEELYRSQHPDQPGNDIYRFIRKKGSTDIVAGIIQMRQESNLRKDEFSQQLTKAIIEATIVERLAQDNYSPVYDFLPNPNKFYVRGWKSDAPTLRRCGELVAYMLQEELPFYTLSGGVPKEAGMGPMFAGYLVMVMSE